MTQSALPPKLELVRNVFWAMVPLVGWSMVTGNFSIALGLIGGASLSLTMGIILQAFIQRLLGTLSGRTTASPASSLNIVGWMIIKFLLAAVACLLFVSIKEISIFAVLAGVVVGQLAIVVTTARHNRSSRV